MKKRIAGFLSLLLILCAAAVPGAAFAKSTDAQRTLAYRLADAKESAELMLANTAYYDGYSQNDLDYRMQKTDAQMDEYKDFAQEQTRDFTDAERELIERCLQKTAMSFRRWRRWFLSRQPWRRSAMWGVTPTAHRSICPHRSWTKRSRETSIAFNT